MAADDVVINIRERGARQTAREVDHVGRSVGGLGTHARGAHRELRLYDRAIVNTSGHLRLLGGAALYGGAALGGVLLIGLKKSVDAWQETRKLTAQTGAVLKSTGGAANVTSGEVDALSASLSRKTAVDQDVIRGGANVLLTFRDIRNEAGKNNDIFTQAVGLTQDLSTAMNLDMRQAALQVGKALNDPARGMTRLQRIGVTFTKGQIAQAKALTESGDRLGAQKIILRELQKEFGGSAVAQATPLDRLKVGVKDLEKAVGHGLQPAVDAVSTSLSRTAEKATPELNALSGRLDKLFARKDLSLGEKLAEGGKDLHRTLAPFEHQLGQEISSMHLEDKLNQGFEYAIPKLANTAGRAAPKIAQAFLMGWLHADVWGKLLTLGLLERKLGVFSLLGNRAGGRFGRGFILGAVGAAAAYEAAKAAATVLGGGPITLGSAATQAGIAADTNLSVRRGRILGHDPVTRAAIARWQAEHPNIDPIHASIGRLTRSGYPAAIPGGPDVPASYAPVVSAAGARAMQIHVYIDGKGVAHHMTVTYGRETARAVRRINDDDTARGRSHP